ncbi:MAG: carotenoid biosynthesis protein [Myxococcota bacterium]|nr:carotenoid biosynthesis protein [Myxococcota bacterium]
MTALFDALGLDAARVVKATFEPNLLLLFAVCLGHSLKTHGWRRTAREFSAGFALTALAESAGVLSGAYVYPGFHLYVLATPVGNPASWVALVYIVMTLSDRLVFGRRALEKGGGLLVGRSLLGTLALLALCDACLALAIDLVLDPLATIYNWWIWVPCVEGATTIGPGVVDAYNFDRPIWLTTPDNPVAVWFADFFPHGFRYPTRVLGIPLINFVAWLVFVFVFAFQFRWVESRRDWSDWRKFGVLWVVVLVDVPVLAVLLIAPNL